jgi:hypothetical protein
VSHRKFPATPSSPPQPPPPDLRDFGGFLEDVGLDEERRLWLRVMESLIDWDQPAFKDKTDLNFFRFVRNELKSWRGER